MRYSYQFLYLLLASALAFSCMGDPVVETMEREEDFDYVYSFSENEKQHWKWGFTAYPAERETNFAPEYSYTLTPEETGIKKPSIRVSGRNQGNGMFMYLYRKIEGLEPETTYQLSYLAEFASNTPRNSIGTGGSPGASVYLKAGAVAQNPYNIQKKAENGLYRLTAYDKGRQPELVNDMISLGNIGTGLSEFKYSMIKRSGSNQQTVTTGKNGELWLVIGTESAYEGVTTLFYTSVKIKATKTDLTASN